MNLIKKIVTVNKKYFINNKLTSNLGWSSLGGFFSSIVMFCIHLFVARVVDVAQYGYFGLVLIVSQNLKTILIGGMDIVVAKQIAQNKKEIVKIITNSFFVVISNILFFGVILYILNFNNIKVWHIFFLASIFGVKFYFDGIIRGLELFRMQVYYKIADNIITFILIILIYIFFKENIINLLLLPFEIGSVIIITILFNKFKKFIKITYFTKEYVQKLWKTGYLFFIASFFSSAIFLIDRVLIDMYLDDLSLGIYTAYSTTSIMLAGVIVSVIVNVFFVHVAKNENKYLISKKIDDIFLYNFGIFFLIFFLSISSAILLFGKKYDYNIFYTCLFSLLSILMIFSALYWPIITTYSNKILLYGIYSLAIRLLFLVVSFYFLVIYDVLSISTILVSLILQYAGGIVLLKYIIKKFINHENKKCENF